MSVFVHSFVFGMSLNIELEGKGIMLAFSNTVATGAAVGAAPGKG